MFSICSISRYHLAFVVYTHMSPQKYSKHNIPPSYRSGVSFVGVQVGVASTVARTHPVGHGASSTNCHANLGSVSFPKMLPINCVEVPRRIECWKMSYEDRAIWDQPDKYAVRWRMLRGPFARTMVREEGYGCAEDILFETCEPDGRCAL